MLPSALLRAAVVSFIHFFGFKQICNYFRDKYNILLKAQTKYLNYPLDFLFDQTFWL